MGSRRPLLAALPLLVALSLAPAAAEAKIVWLCEPGQRANPCEPGLTTTNFSPSGERTGVERVRRAARRKADCFYVYPTVSDQKRPQATQVVDDVLRSIALYQAARYSRDCRVFAPVYRQITVRGLADPGSVTAEMGEEGYRDVRQAWRHYLRAENNGRGVVLIGHSQGTFILRRLIREEIDPSARARRRIVSAVLLGGNVTVAKGRDRGGDFRNVPACRSARQLGCVVAFSAFGETPPANSLFGRTGEPNREILCNNPGALRGGPARVTPVYPTKPFADSVIGAAANLAAASLPKPPTPWVAIPRGVRVFCSKAGGAGVLRVRPLGDTFTVSPIPDSTWGLHLIDANVALGDLADLVKRQIARHAGR